MRLPASDSGSLTVMTILRPGASQATDRAHRIGQTRVATSYKLITRGTVEEKILSLQQRKREIINATIGGEEQFTEALGWDEIQELLA